MFKKKSLRRTHTYNINSCPVVLQTHRYVGIYLISDRTQHCKHYVQYRFVVVVGDAAAVVDEYDYDVCCCCWVWKSLFASKRVKVTGE
jgi:hypothetical protein